MPVLVDKIRRRVSSPQPPPGVRSGTLLRRPLVQSTGLGISQRINPSVDRLSDGTWRFTWSAGSPPYSVWLEGFQIDSGLTDEQFDIAGSPWDTKPPPVEILNDGEEAQNKLYPPYVEIQWRGLTDAAAYVVQELKDSTWEDVASFMEDGSGYYKWSSLPQTDGDTPQFRVMALSSLEVEGTPISFTLEVVRNPDSPDVSLSIDSAGDVVVSSA